VRNAAKLVLVNRGETPYDRVATMRLWVGIADVLPKAVERVKTLRGKE